MVDIPAVGIAVEKYYNGDKQSIDKDRFQLLISESYCKKTLPVLFGDLIKLPNGSYKVISSDQIICNLAKIIMPRSTIFLSDVDGVFLQSNNFGLDDKYLSHELNTTNISQLFHGIGDHYDVSGGMRKKAEIALEISKYSKKCFIGNGKTPGILEDLLKNRKVKGTYVNIVKD
jgi:isopentenyl phosphate kinase